MTIPVDRLSRPGEVLLVDLEPVRGTEQNVHRPALVISNEKMHLLARRVIICPITRNRDPWPTKVIYRPVSPQKVRFWSIRSARLIGMCASSDLSASFRTASSWKCVVGSRHFWASRRTAV